MAIWPFGRKNKRHTIQVSAEEADVLQTALDHGQAPPTVEPTLGRKPSRRRSIRQAHRLSRNGDGSESLRESARLSVHRPVSSLEPRSSDPDDRAKPDGPQRPLSRTGSLLKKAPHNNGSNGPNKLRKSKRRTDEAIREREIKMLSSTPIDIPHRSSGLAAGGDYVLEHRRRKANGRRADRYLSDISLSIRDSAASSLSDTSDPYTYKVNAFAALTPRPVVRYVEAPRPTTVRSNTEPIGPGRHDKNKRANDMSQEDLYYSRRRVNELADSLDASTLRELLDRDRRRREKKQLDDAEKLHRKLQERADAQKAECEQKQDEEEEDQPQIQLEEPQEEPQEEPRETESQVEAPAEIPEETYKERFVETIPEETTGTPPAEQSESWLREESKGSDVVGGGESRRASLENANTTGDADVGSTREPKLVPRASFAPSHEMGMSRTTLSPSHSSIRHGLNSSHSQTFGVGSTSDISDRRPSETSGHRNGGNTITSLFRRGSSRIKRRYRERFQDSSPDVSNASHESFYKIQTQSSPPQTSSTIPPRAFVQPTGIVKRSQSKFTEHFGDEPPLSPPDSRIQSPSPDIPEQVAESSMENEATFLHGPTPTPGMDIINPHKRRHQSWNESIDAESDNVPLSQSLASIDSEGSWMSGQFFRRMAQKPPGSPVRTQMNSFGASPVDSPVEGKDDARESIDSRSGMSNVMGEPELETDAAASDTKKPSEMWHHEVGRRPMIVNPTTRPKSNQGLLRTIPTLSPISAEDGHSSEEEAPPRPGVQRIVSMHGEIGHISNMEQE